LLAVVLERQRFHFVLARSWMHHAQFLFVLVLVKSNGAEAAKKKKKT
jgi:hypothetical protein